MQLHRPVESAPPLLFFEKPGCGGNARQRALLLSAGHTLERRNLLTAHRTRESLLAFLGRLPVAEWFNRAAPRVKSGEVRPEAQTMEGCASPTERCTAHP